MTEEISEQIPGIKEIRIGRMAVTEKLQNVGKIR